MSRSKIKTIYHIIRYNGLGFCFFRAQYNLRSKIGLLKRNFPAQRWDQITLTKLVKPEVDSSAENFLKANQSNGRRFFFAGESLPVPDEKYKDRIISDAELIIQNKFRYFFNESYSLGNGPNWFCNPATGAQAKFDVHWTDVSTFDPAAGDIKFIWEPSRFAWVYTLVRAYAVTADDKYAEKFWQLLESWLDANQPNTGPNYSCGQECAIRLLAMCFAYHALTDAKPSSADRKIKLIIAIAVHAERIDKNIKFAISTRTNHSITEAAALYTAGLLFPEFKPANFWRRKGKNILTQEGLKQIYEDGSYLQHSMNYHRLMLQNYLWVLRLGQLNNDIFNEELVTRITKATDFLFQMQDDESGRIPNYGPNDGALIIPLNTCDYLDYRPVIQALWYLLKEQKLYDKGPWDEDLLWFFGLNDSAVSSADKLRESKRFDTGGYYTIRNGNSWAMMRCHSYRDRPGHIDMLHFDLWADGVNLLRDCGSYKYYAPDEQDLERYFKSIWAHNTVIVDDASPVELVSKFTWMPWPKGQLLKFTSTDNRYLLQGRHFAYARGPWHVTHNRQIQASNNQWLITDDISGTGSHRAELRWHLPANAEIGSSDDTGVLVKLINNWRLKVTANNNLQTSIIKSEVSGGWESLYYGNKQEIFTLSVISEGKAPLKFETIVSKG